MAPASRRRIAAAVATTLLALTGAAASTGTPAVASPVTAPAVGGSQTSGDTLFPDIGNGGYNVRHYAIKLAYATSGSIRATTTIQATASKRLSSFSLDLEGLTVERVAVAGRTAAYSHLGSKLVVTPRTPVTGRFEVVVRYSGTPKPHIDPDDALDGWVPTRDGATVVAEPVGAMTWFPNNNTPRDKATFRVAVDVPKHLEVAGSGDLAGRQRHGARTTWIWRQTRPMATYLAMISIGNYDVYHSSMKTTTGETLPIWSFIEPSLGSLASQRAMIPKIIRFEEQRFGRYPFGSTGIVVKDLPVDYSLETQNRPVFDAAADNLPDTALLVHELAHQWYGDSVTPRDWGDIWLNEGFATYAEWWWAAAHGGPSTAQSLQSLYDTNPSKAALWSPAPAGLSDAADLFSDPVYDRGAMTLEALRQRVGAANFATIMKRWATEHRGGTVTTTQFIRLAERISKQDLDDLFHDWLYVAARPARS